MVESLQEIRRRREQLNFCVLLYNRVIQSCVISIGHSYSIVHDKYFVENFQSNFTINGFRYLNLLAREPNEPHKSNQMEGSGTDNQHNDEYFDTHSFVKLEDLHSWQNRTTNSNSSMCTNPLSSVEQFILGTDGQEGKIKWSYNIDPKEIHLEKQLGNGTFGSVWQAKCRGVDG